MTRRLLLGVEPLLSRRFRGSAGPGEGQQQPVRRRWTVALFIFDVVGRAEGGRRVPVAFHFSLFGKGIARGEPFSTYKEFLALSRVLVARVSDFIKGRHLWTRCSPQYNMCWQRLVFDQQCPHITNLCITVFYTHQMVVWYVWFGLDAASRCILVALFRHHESLNAKVLVRGLVHTHHKI